MSTPAETAGTDAAAAKPRKKGVVFYLIIIGAVGLVAGAAWFFFGMRSQKASKTNQAASSAPAKPVRLTSAQEQAARIKNVPIPITRDALAYGIKRPMRDDVDYDNVYILDMSGIPRDLAKADRITASITGPGNFGTKYIVTRIAVMIDSPGTLSKINLNRQRILSAIMETLSNRAVQELARPGFKQAVQRSLQEALVRILGYGSIQEVIFLEFEVN